MSLLFLVMNALLLQEVHSYVFPSALQSVFTIKSATGTTVGSSNFQVGASNRHQQRRSIQKFTNRPLQAGSSSSSGGDDDNNSAEGSGADIFEQLKVKLKGTCVYFIGMMGSGKSTLGSAFANKMGYRFLDTDEIAEFMVEMPLSDYFAQGKVDEFRELEYQVLMELAQYTRVVVATGGGIVMKQENWGLLRHGIVVYVDMPVEDIYERLKADPSQIAKRPLLQGDDPLDKLRKLSAERQDKYIQADVHLRIPAVPMTPDQLADLTAKTMLEFIAANPPLWESWKKQRDETAVEAAARFNPSATAAAGVGFGQEKDQGSIKYISLQDIQNGKAILPSGPSTGKGQESTDDEPMPFQ